MGALQMRVSADAVERERAADALVAVALAQVAVRPATTKVFLITQMKPQTAEPSLSRSRPWIWRQITRVIHNETTSTVSSTNALPPVLYRRRTRRAYTE